MAMKQPTLASFDFKMSSNDKDGPSLSKSGENTKAYSSLIPDMHGPKKRKFFQSSWLSQFDWRHSDKKNGTMHRMNCENYIMLLQSGHLSRGQKTFNTLLYSFTVNIILMFHFNETTDYDWCLKFHFLYPQLHLPGGTKNSSQNFQWTQHC